ncbi:MAG: thiolase family protein [Candidatus Dormibacteraeota bacterium]|nr:thiolase family protein [Candidatus Dormibacteraeota bacterium]
MRFERAYIPHGCYWSTPFARWQGSLAQQHPIKLAATVAVRVLQERGADPAALDSVVFGMTVPSPGCFYATPWLAGMIGAPEASGPAIMQACATGARVIAEAAGEVEAGASRVLGITADRTSNGPHLYYPDASGPGGRGVAEDWVWDNFQNDPFALAGPMAATAENVAHRERITREEQDEVALLRHEQYRADRESGGEFQRAYMAVPLEVQDAAGRKVVATLTDDEGVFPTTAEGLARLRPASDGGTVTLGTQTHPADGNAGLLVTGREDAGELSRDSAVEVQILSFGQARVGKGLMPTAPVPAARRALADAGIGIEDVAAVKTHNPFAVNDVFLSRAFDLPLDRFNRHGSSLVYGHPQGPTGMRLVIELIEELVERGGGLGLFTGCAAGDTGAAIVVRVDTAPAARGRPPDQR